jgi:hypothetical protein
LQLEGGLNGKNTPKTALPVLKLPYLAIFISISIQALDDLCDNDIFNHDMQRIANKSQGENDPWRFALGL